MIARLALGVDVSTAEVRVIALDLDRAVSIGAASVTLPVVVGEHGIREQDADYGSLALQTIDTVLVALHDGFEVVAVSVTATSGTVVPVDAQGRQRGAGVMYDDARGLPFERGLPPGTGRPRSMLGRMMAMAAGDPGFRAASVSQVIGSALVGHPVHGDTSHFLKAGVDPASAVWLPDLVAESRLAGDTFPSLVQPGTILGTVAVGRAAGGLLVAGMTDGCTSQLASGAVRDGQSVGVLGTTLVLKCVSDVDRWDAATGIYAHRSPDGRFWVGGASNVGGGSVARPSNLGYREIELLARAAGPSPIVRYPLDRPGERFPIADPGLAAFTVDLRGKPASDLDPVVVYRAGLEGVAMVERLGLESLGLYPSAGQRALSGGGTRNRLWNEVRAACLGAVVRIPAHADSGYGAAVLAAWAVQDDSFADVVARYTSGGELVDPDPELVLAMSERYAVFRAALSARTA